MRHLAIIYDGNDAFGKIINTDSLREARQVMAGKISENSEWTLEFLIPISDVDGLQVFSGGQEELWDVDSMENYYP